MAPTAPPIDGDLWLNTEPLTPEDLTGRVVIVVFWSASCEASLRRLQDVERLIATADASDDGGAGSMVAVAVHSPRLTCDDDLDRLRHVVARHRIVMPVVHDPGYRTWTRYDPPGWPSTAVIDRRGRVTGMAAGCHDFDLIAAATADALQRPPGRRRADRDIVLRPLPGPPAQAGPGEDSAHDAPASALSYPEGLAVVPRRASMRLAMADGGNDRLIIGRIDNSLRTVLVDLILTGVDQPSSIAFTDPVSLTVVERATNIVSSIDVSSGVRSVITDGLVRPAGLTVDIDGSLVITDAGADRLYRATANSDRSGHLVLPIAGSGRHGTAAGWAGDAELAQPVAVVRTGAGLVFADAASSNLRLLTDAGEVVNITDSDLFDWGLLDGPAHRARLQRPAGLTAAPDGSIIVVDSGNDRLRRLHHRRIETIGLRGLDSPTAAIAVDRTKVLVADTANHRLIAVDTVRQDGWPVTIDGFEDARTISVETAAETLSSDRAASDQVSSGSATSAT